MKLLNLAEEIWKNSTVIELHPRKTWDTDFFLKTWFQTNQYTTKYTTTSPGWYWIGCDIGFQELEKVSPSIEDKLPKSACKISELTRKNLETFSSDGLCKKNEKECLIIYNGHQSNVINRIRQHFMLNNDQTGAIGLSHYPLSDRKWTISYFAKNNIQQLKKKAALTWKG